MLFRSTRNVAHIGLFRPIILNADGSDAMLDLLRNRYDIDQRPEDTYCMTIAEAATYFESGQPEKVIERAVDAFAALKSKYEFMVVIGTDYLGPAAGTELELNAELAANLGAPPRTVFRTVMLPLTLPGILTGCVFVFVPSLGNFVVPELLGGGKLVMVGNLIRDQFLKARDWPFGATLALIVIAFLAVLLVLQARAARAATTVPDA